MEKGIEQGIEAGRNEHTRAVALKLLQTGMPDEQICEVAECDMKLLEEIRKTLK